MSCNLPEDEWLLESHMREATRLELELKALRALAGKLPRCVGAWLNGSGGHAIFSRDCRRVATWADDGEATDDWMFCDEHAPERLKNNGSLCEITELPWAPEVRELAL